MTADEGRSATLECLSEGDPDPVMKWRKVKSDTVYGEGKHVRNTYHHHDQWIIISFTTTLVIAVKVGSAAKVNHLPNPY